MKHSLLCLILLSSLGCPDPSGGAPADDDDDAAGPVEAGTLTLTGLSVDIPTLNAVYIPDAAPFFPGTGLVQAAVDLDCDRLRDYNAAMEEPWSAYQEAGDYDAYIAALADAWNEPYGVPGWSLAIQIYAGSLAVGPWDPDASRPFIAIARLDPPDGSGLPFTNVALTGEQQMDDATIDSLEGGLFGTFDFSVQTGVDDEGVWIVEQIQVRVDATTCAS